jgi:phage shock protein A
MGIFSRFSDIVNSNINAILEKAEDPEKIVRLMIQEMEDTLVEVRSAAARAIADRKEANRKLGQLEAEVADKNREDLARAALSEKASAEKAADGLREQLAHLTDGLDKLNDDIASLEEKLTDAKARRQAIVARHNTASKRLEVRKRLHDYRIDDALVKFESFERRMEDIEGHVESYDLGKRSLADEITNLESEEAVEKQLAELKAKRAATEARNNKTGD